MKKPNGYLTKEKCMEISSKYNIRSEFKKSESSVYATAIRNKWLSDICSHMKLVKNYWNYEKCKNVALKYKTKTNFQKGNHGAYEFARLNNFLDEICEHMIKGGNKYFRCIYVYEFSDNHAYVGLTYNLTIRKNDHLRNGSVCKHIKNSESSYIIKQLTDYIFVDQAQKLETEYFNEYKKMDG